MADLKYTDGAEELAEENEVDLEEVAEAGFVREEDNKVLKSHVEEYLEAGDEDDSEEAEDEPEADDGDPEEVADSSEGVVFYWVKGRSYISEDEILEAGLYRSSEEFDRLDRSKKRYVEKYGELTRDILVDYAREVGMDYRGVDTEDLYDQIVKELD